MTRNLFYPILLILLNILHLRAPRRNGLLALSQVLAPYLFAPLLLLIPATIKRGAYALRAAQVVCLLLFWLRFRPVRRKQAAKATNSDPDVSVLSWNALMGGDQKHIRDFLLTRPADVVALVETHAEWITNDAELSQLYPYHVLRLGAPDVSMALLSAFPILDSISIDQLNVASNPLRLIWAKLDLGQNRSLQVVAAHPPPPHLLAPEPLKDILATGYSVAERDGALVKIRAFIEPLLQADQPFVLVGDFNLTNREPAYREISAGLQSAQDSAGAGINLTWRPESLRWQPVAILRIDHQFSSPNVTPLSLTVDCTPRNSDHCALLGRYRVD